MLDTERERHLGGADIRGIGENFRHREDAALRVIVVDLEFSVTQRAARIEARTERDLSGIERHRHGQRLEGRAHLEHAGGQAVNAGRIERLARIVRVVIRHRHHRDDFAGANVGDQTRGRDLDLVFLLRREQFVAQRVLHAQIDGELDRLLQPVGGEAGHVQIGKPARVEPFLDAGNALVVDIDVADDVGDHCAVRVDALVLGQEADTGNTELVDVLLLLGRDFALEPDEAALGGEPLAHFAARRDRAGPR